MATVMVLSILLLVTTPILSFLRFLVSVVCVPCCCSAIFQLFITRLYTQLLLFKFGFQTSQLSSQVPDAHWIFQRRDSVSELKLLQTDLIFFDSSLEVLLVQSLDAFFKIYCL